MTEPTSLEVASFVPNECVGGAVTRWTGGRLEIDLDAVTAVGTNEPSIAEVRAWIVGPTDPVRIVNVLDAVEPAVKTADPKKTFPGALGPPALAGRGRTNRIDGVAVIPTCDWRKVTLPDAEELPAACVDMGGPGAERSAWSATTNVVLSFSPQPGAPVAELDRAIRRSTLRTARDLAATTAAEEPDHVETYPDVSDVRDGDLPAVCVILQVGSEGPLFDTFLYGRAMQGMDPTLLDPREVLDGALTSGAYDWAGMRNPTAFYQRNSLIRELFAADGKRARFAGVIAALGYLDSGSEKQRSAMLSARLAQQLGADGVVCTTFESGNSHTDTMLTVRACERLGIRTVAMVAETNGGLTDSVPEADAIVSVGNEDELVPAWTPERVLGGDDPFPGRPVPTWAYLGAASQMGDMRWTAAAL